MSASLFQTPTPFVIITIITTIIIIIDYL